MSPDSVHTRLADLDAHQLLGLVLEICHRRGVTPSELCGMQRTRSASLARHEAWAIIHQLPDRSYSYSDIARLFGRDPSTVLAGIRAHLRRNPS